MIDAIIAWIQWDPSQQAFTLPGVNLSIAWYGILFALGFVGGYLIFVPIVTKTIKQLRPASPIPARKLALQFTDRITWFIVLGTIIGARLGHVFFYDWPYYAAHPLEIIMIRNGGLASHGGTVGVLLGISLFLYWNHKYFPEISWIRLLDMLVIPTAFTAFCIRMGNFFNQEILGIPTQLPWAIVFGHPADGSLPVPRHPVQLYEALAYLAIFGILYTLWHKKYRPGLSSGLFFILIFGSRFFLEFLKTHQSAVIDENVLQMGQYLSIPFILFGVFLVSYGRRKH